MSTDLGCSGVGSWARRGLLQDRATPKLGVRLEQIERRPDRSRTWAIPLGNSYGTTTIGTDCCGSAKFPDRGKRRARNSVK